MTQEFNDLGQPISYPVPDWQPVPFPTRVTLQGRFCRVEPLDAARHGRDLFDANTLDTEGRNWTYLAYGPFATYDEYHTWLSEAAQSSDPLYFTIIDLRTNKAVGVGSYLRIDPKMGVIEIGHLNFSPLLQAKPAATEAMYLMMRQAFEWGYRRYEWKCHSMHSKSRRAAQRFGFSYEGTFRQAVVVKGRNRDTAWYAIIDKDWPALKTAFETWLDPSNFDPQGKQKRSLGDLTSAVATQRD